MRVVRQTGLLDRRGGGADGTALPAIQIDLQKGAFPGIVTNVFATNIHHP